MSQHKGIKLALRYAYVPCQLGLCGPDDIKKRNIMRAYLEGTQIDKESIRKIKTEFRGAYKYYELIAIQNKIKDPLDYRVVEAYWTGNVYLNKIKGHHLQRMANREFLPLGKITKKK